MADATPKTVTVTTLKWHTNGGKAYDIGDTYDVTEGEVDNLTAQGMAKPSDDVKADTKAAKSKK